MLNFLNDKPFKERVLDNALSTLDLLTEFPACEISFVGYLSMLPPIRPRYYSISSSSLKYPHTCSITVSVLQLPHLVNHTIFEGFCSNYLAKKLPKDFVKASVTNENPYFRLPQNTDIPLVLICAGTGIAPFRGFLQEREAWAEQNKKVGKAILFFGIRHPEKDYLYREELQKLSEKGIVDIYLAPSRLDGQPKCYVQDLLWQKKEFVWELIKKDSIFYVCGEGSKMAPAVKDTMRRIYTSNTSCSNEDSIKWIEELVDKHLYREDVWSFEPTIGSSA